MLRGQLLVAVACFMTVACGESRHASSAGQADTLGSSNLTGKSTPAASVAPTASVAPSAAANPSAKDCDKKIVKVTDCVKVVRETWQFEGTSENLIFCTRPSGVIETLDENFMTGEIPEGCGHGHNP